MNRRGLSTTIEMLTIVVAVVVLSASLVLFASGIFQSNVQEEAIGITSANLWGVNSTHTQGAFIVKNTGAKELAIQRIKVRGIESVFSNWYYFSSAGSNITTQTKLSYDTDNVLTSITVSGAARTFTQASGPISLKPGDVFVIYMKTPGSLDSSDTGSSVTFEVSAKQATQVLRVTVASK